MTRPALHQASERSTYADPTKTMGASGEPTAKRAKKDKEDPLVRRRNELIFGVINARVVGKRLVRAAEEKAKRRKLEADDVAERMKQEAFRLKQEAQGRKQEALRLKQEALRLKQEALRLERQAQGLKREAAAEDERMVREAKENAILVYDRALSETTQTFAKAWRSVCAGLQAKNEKELLKKLPAEVWSKIVDENVQQNDLLALASTCRFFREKQKDLGKKMETNLSEDHFLKLLKSGNVPPHSLDWFQWASDTLEFLPGFVCDDEERVEGAVYEGDLLNYAAFQGSVEILRWLMEEKGLEENEGTGFWAGGGGSVEILEYLEGRGYKFTEAACDGAAMGGRLEALKHLRGLDPPCPWGEETCADAAYGGHLDVLKWLRSEDPPCPWDELTCSRAAEGGHLHVLKWMRDQDPPCPWEETTCARAAGVGHLEVLKWVRDQDPPCPWHPYTCARAAEEGHLEILKWLRAQDPPCPWDYNTCSWAAGEGHLDVLEWARAQNPPCPWDEETCADAAREGHLDVLKWARSQDPPCPWSRDECREKAWEGDHEHVVDWIDQQEDESDVESFDYDSYDDD